MFAYFGKAIPCARVQNAESYVCATECMIGRRGRDVFFIE